MAKIQAAKSRSSKTFDVWLVRNIYKPIPRAMLSEKTKQIKTGVKYIYTPKLHDGVAQIS